MSVGDINAYNSGLRTLPDITDVLVTGDIFMYGNELQTLKGLPRTIEGDLVVRDNKLENLYCLAGVSVKGNLFCAGNPVCDFGGDFAKAHIQGLF